MAGPDAEGAELGARDREMIRIFVRPTAKQAVAEWADVMGQSEMHVASRLLEWFERQPTEVKKWVTAAVDLGEPAGMRMFALEALRASEQALDVLRGVGEKELEPGVEGSGRADESRAARAKRKAR